MALLRALTANAQTVDPWPAAAWGASSNLTYLNPVTWTKDLSSAYWNPQTRRLWLSDNGGTLTVLREDAAGGFLKERDYTVTGLPTPGAEGMTQASDTNYVYVTVERTNLILQVAVESGVTNTIWNLASLVGNVNNDGPEGIAFIPDAWLAKTGFRDGNGDLYPQSTNGANGLGGIMLVAVQHCTRPTAGYVFAVDLHTNGTWSTVGQDGRTRR